jgi:hypothetical protein
MSSHRNSAYSGQSLLEMPARDLTRVPGREFRSYSKTRSTFSQGPDQIWGKYNQWHYCFCDRTYRTGRLAA